MPLGDLIGQVVADRGPERGSSQDVTKVSCVRACVEAGPRRISLYSCINKWTTAQDVEFGDERDGTGDGPGGDRGAAARLSVLAKAPAARLKALWSDWLAWARAAGP
jgi:hypothetical protein